MTNFTESWSDEPTRGEGYEPIHTAEYWAGRREGRMDYALERLRGLAKALRDGGDPATVARLIDTTIDEAIGNTADDGRALR